LPLAADLESALREFAAAGLAELRGNGARVRRGRCVILRQ
jgi:hypothetical protein